MDPVTALLILDVLAVALAKLPEAREQYEALRTRVEAMVTAERNPTAEEWAEFKQAHAETRARLLEIIQAAREDREVSAG